MKTYRVVIPAWWEEVEAETPKEAHDIAMYDYDQEQGEMNFNQPEVYEVGEGKPKLRRVKIDETKTIH